MKRFNYQASDTQRVVVQGTIAAADADAALGILLARGFTEIELSQVDLMPLSASEAAELAGYLVELARSGLPVAGRLEGLARDTASPALQTAYRQMSAELSAGRSLPEVLDQLSGTLPEHYRRTLAVAFARGDLPQTLDHLLTHQQRVEEMSRRLRQAMAYPVLLGLMLLAWLLFVAWDVLPPLASAALDPYAEWNAESAEAVLQQYMLHFVSVWLPRLLLGSVLGAVMLVLVVLLVGGRAALSKLLGMIPLLGPCWKNLGLADFCGLLGEFVRQQIPLDEALQLTGAACRDPRLAQAASLAREEVLRGKSLVRALRVQRAFPPTVEQWAYWGESHAALPQAMQAAGDLAAQRFNLRVQLLQAVLPAVVFVSIAVSALTLMSVISQALLSLAEMVSFADSDSADISTHMFAILGSLAILAIGLAAWFTARFIDAAAARVVERAIHAFGLTMMVVGLFATGFMLGSYVGLLAVIVLIAALWRAAKRYRDIQKQSLWAAMTLAAERGAPLAPLALAVADEQGGRGARDARRLAEQLSRGVDLADSVEWTHGALPKLAPMAVRVGSDVHDLQGAFEAAAVARDASRPLLSPSLTWLAFYLPVALGLVAFTQVMIMPSIVTIFEDFDTRLPSSTIAASAVLDSGYLPWALMFLGLVLVFVGLQWRGFPWPVLPFLATTVRLWEVGPVLRLLALAVRQGQPLGPAIASMARLHPRGWVRRRLDRVQRDLQGGASWQDGFQRRGLVASGDLALLRAAERNGNLDWALDQLGSSYHRRAEYRLRAFEEFAFPLLVLSVGLLVAGFAIAYFSPLVDLILRLA